MHRMAVMDDATRSEIVECPHKTGTAFVKRIDGVTEARSDSERNIAFPLRNGGFGGGYFEMGRFHLSTSRPNTFAVKHGSPVMPRWGRTQDS